VIRRGFDCLLLMGLFACSHPQTTAPASTQASEDAPRLPSARAATPRTEPGHAPLTAGPEFMLKPGAADALAEQLRARGLLAPEASTSQDLARALRAFQKSEGLAETGFPDRETVRRLGLDPKDVDATLEGAARKRQQENETTSH
jgi:Putative peptidoglycan binding domain